MFLDFLCECTLLQKITLNKRDFKIAFPRLSILSKEPRCPALPSQLSSFKTRPTLEVCGLAPPDGSARQWWPLCAPSWALNQTLLLEPFSFLRDPIQASSQPWASGSSPGSGCACFAECAQLLLGAVGEEGGPQSEQRLPPTHPSFWLR